MKNNQRKRKDIEVSSNPLLDVNNPGEPFTSVISNAERGGPCISMHTSTTTCSYIDLGDCDRFCEHCGARFWYAERINHKYTHQAKYSHCCKGGRVRLELPQEPPDILRQLYQQQHFLDNIRAYNSMFAMTSFGAQVDETINTGSGPYVFKIEGQICHWIGSLCPPPNEKPRFLQMYIYDTERELSHRLNSFEASPRTKFDENIVKLLISFLENYNEIVKLFRSARDLCLTSVVPDFSIRLHHSPKKISYDSPTVGTIGAIICENSPGANDFDIIIHSKDGFPKRVNKLHPMYMALQYPLLFLYGESGWSPELRLTSDNNNREKNLTANMFYSYMIHDRIDIYSVLLRSGRLFQQYLVDAYVCIEQFRLDYIRSHQNLFRVEYLQGIHDAISRGDTEGQAIGKRVFLPTSFTGGPRYMYKHYQDALAICRVYGNPQYFITFTCNVKWPEITRFLQSFHPLKPQDRPDIIARVFRIKVAALIDFLRTECPFGRVVADLYTIEFQKRGLPHCHMLLWVAEPFRIHNPMEIDKYISAEIPDPVLEPQLHKIIADSMMHGPCGIAKRNAPCMVDGSCSKHFPKKYEPKTRFDKNGYAHYKRISNGLSVNKNGILLDNAYVVPYNRTLCLRFQAHINVEYCGWNMVIKYLIKYISKGADRIRFTLTKTSNIPSEHPSQLMPNIDEITNFVDGRYICPHEAAWRLLDFGIHHRNPSVQVLAVHLENMQSIRFTDSQHLQDVIQNPTSKKTTLTEWLRKNKDDPSGRHLRYIDYLSEYTWDASSKLWKRRVRNRTPTIGRLIYIHPSCGETFYLRMLLSHQRGCTSYDDIKTVNGHIMPTFRATCEKLGLLEDDNEWSQAFNDAATWATASELRSLFAHMLLHCEMSNPVRFWSQHWKKMSDDIVRRLGTILPNSDMHVDDTYIKQKVLYEVEFLLNSHTTPSSLSNFGLPMPQEHLLASLRNKLLMEEKNYDKEKLAAEHEYQKSSLQGRQLQVYESVIDSIDHNKQILLFVYGHGGTGKTFLWKTIINALRSQGKIVLAVATSGIASLLLPSGRTAHSRFKLPYDTTIEKNCQITKNTQLAQLLAETSLIIWDEAPMNDRKCFESLDRSLKDILDNNVALFGGKSVLLGGDFRQTLPVKRKATKAQILVASLPMSYIWEHFRVVRLTENMRLRQPNTTTTNVIEIATFAEWLLQIGDGTLGIPDEVDPDNTRHIEIPPKYLMSSKGDEGLYELINFIYDDNTLHHPTASNLLEKAIVCPKNVTTDLINELVLERAPGECTSYLSTDSIIPHTKNRADLEFLYPTEYLHKLNFSGLPPHELRLKVNTPVILLRNLNQTACLCNGTRLLITQLLPRILEAQIITGTAVGHRVYIPRIILTHEDKELPFIFKRKQFPLRLCYAMCDTPIPEHPETGSHSLDLHKYSQSS